MTMIYLRWCKNPECGKMFATDRRNKNTCSPTCSKRANKIQESLRSAERRHNRPCAYPPCRATISKHAPPNRLYHTPECGEAHRADKMVENAPPAKQVCANPVCSNTFDPSPSSHSNPKQYCTQKCQRISYKLKKGGMVDGDWPFPAGEKWGDYRGQDITPRVRMVPHPRWGLRP